MNFYGDYHTHTKHSDGVGSVEDNVLSAIQKNLKEVAITEHGPRNINMSLNRIWKSEQNVIKARQKYKDINILFGVECDILSERGEIDIKEEDYSRFDLMLAGFHRFAIPRSWRDFRRYYMPSFFHFNKYFLTDSIITRNTKALISAITKHPIDIVAHINNRSIVNVVEVARACADLGVLIEINAKHLHECEPIIEEMLAIEEVSFIANTDAHFPKRVGGFDKVQDFIMRHKMQKRVINIDNKPLFRRR